MSIFYFEFECTSIGSGSQGKKGNWLEKGYVMNIKKKEESLIWQKERRDWKRERKTMKAKHV